jgi:EAL domain-containing protein (putative c-di-GMP-specific phosphodiesterase class I)
MPGQVVGGAAESLALEDSPGAVPLQLEPIVRPTIYGLKLESVEVMAGGLVASRYSKRGALLELDTLIAEAAIDLTLPDGVGVHLNLPKLDGLVVADVRYREALRRLARRRRLVLEIHETTFDSGFREAEAIARLTGAELAVDDLAPGNFGWQWVLDALVNSELGGPKDTGTWRARGRMLGKVDVAWFHDAMQSSDRWNRFSAALHRFAGALDALIVEGVETVQHLEILRTLDDAGLPLAYQGYLINAQFPGLSVDVPRIHCP